MGAAAFALGLALAGPQAAGQAVAEDSEPSAPAASADSGDARGGASRGGRAVGQARPGRVVQRDADPPARGAAAVRRAAADAERGGEVGTDAGDSGAELEQPVVEVRVLREPEVLPADPVEVVVADPVDVAAPEDAEAIAYFSTGVTPPATPMAPAVPAVLPSATAADVAESVAGLNAAVSGFFDSVSRLLSSLPANPVGDFLSGALLLTRRTLFNDLPQAQPSVFGVTASGLIEGSVAVDTEGDILTASLTDAPDFGTVQFDSTGGFAYSPGPEFAGIDSFTVSVSDGGFNLLAPAGGRSIEVTVPIGTVSATGAGYGAGKCDYGAKGCVLYPGEGLYFNQYGLGHKFQIFNMTNYRVVVADYVPVADRFPYYDDGLVTLQPYTENDVVDQTGRSPWYVVLNTSSKGYGTASCRSDGSGCYYPDPTWRTDAFASVAVLLDYGCFQDKCYNTLGKEYDFDPNSSLTWGNSVNPITGADVKRVYDAMLKYNANVFDANCNNWGCNSYANQNKKEFQNVTADTAALLQAGIKSDGQSAVAESINPTPQSKNNVTLNWKAVARPQPVPDSPWWVKIGRFATDNLLGPVLKTAGVAEAIAGAITSQVKNLLGPVSADDVQREITFEGTTAGIQQVLLPYSLSRVIVSAPNSLTAKGDLVFTLPSCVGGNRDRGCPSQVPTPSSSDSYIAAWRFHDLEYVMPNRYDYSFTTQFEAKPYQPETKGVKQSNAGFTMVSDKQTVSNPTYQVGESDSLRLKAFVGAGVDAALGEDFSQKGCSGDITTDCTTFTVKTLDGKPAAGVEVTVGADRRATLRANEPGTYVVQARYDWQLLRPLTDTNADGWYRDYVLATMEVKVS